MKYSTQETNCLYSSKEWKNKRAEFIEGKPCEWCDSTEKLVVHYTYTMKIECHNLKNKLIRELLFEKMYNTILAISLIHSFLRSFFSLILSFSDIFFSNR